MDFCTHKKNNMKTIFSYLVITLFVVLCSIKQTIAQCSISSPTITLNSATNNGDSCKVSFNFAFDMVHNGGNKYIFLHFWLTNNYPNLSYSAPPSLTDLANTVLNFGINNFGTVSAMSSYLPYPTLTPFVSNENITVIVGATNDHYIIQNLSVTVAGLCSSSIILQGDGWSTQASSANVVHCYSKGVSIGLNDPQVSGSCNNSTLLGSYSFSVSSTNPTSHLVNYKVYLDNGDGVFNPATDSVLSNVSGSAMISSTSPYNSGSINYPTSPYNANVRKIYITASNDGTNYSVNTTIYPCASGGPLDVNWVSLSANVNNQGKAVINWQVEELSVKSYIIEKSSDGINFELLTSVNGKGDGRNYYSLIDQQGFNGMAFYRIKEQELSGKYSYSSILKVSSLSSIAQLHVYPNPTNGSTTIHIDNITSQTYLTILDNTGKIVKTLSSINNNEVDISGLTRGFYFLRFTNVTTHDEEIKKLIVN